MRSAGLPLVVLSLLMVSGCCSRMSELFDGAGDVPEAVDEPAGAGAAQAAGSAAATDGEDATPDDSFTVGPAGDGEPGGTDGGDGVEGGEGSGDGIDATAGAGGEVGGGTAGEGYVVSATDDSSTLFAKLDVDGDGLIASSEFRGDADEFAEVDRNDDGYIDAEEARNSRPAGRGRPGDFIGRMDRDGDGRVSRDEFPGRQQRWDRLDSNGDGYIEASEAPARE